MRPPMRPFATIKDGMLKCAPAVPVPDCTERTNLRKYGTADMFFSYRAQVCLETHEEYSEVSSATGSARTCDAAPASALRGSGIWTNLRDNRAGPSLRILYHHRTAALDGMSVHIDRLVSRACGRGAMRFASSVPARAKPRRAAVAGWKSSPTG